MKAVFLFLVEVEGGSAMEKQQVEDFICGKKLPLISWRHIIFDLIKMFKKPNFGIFRSLP